VADGLREPLVGRFGKRKPSPRMDLPVVDAREAVGGERLQHPCNQPKKPFDLHDLPFAEDRFEAMEPGAPSALERLVDEVDVQPHIP